MRIVEESKLRVHVGERFGHWTVVGVEFFAAPASQSHRYVVCQCDCGRHEALFLSNILDSKSTQCIMCRAKSGKRNSNYVHGESKTRLYKSWSKMIERCENQSYHAFGRYGGRGISVCREWRHNFAAFRDWALEKGWRKGLQIDRIDNDGNYEPSNCQWLTKSDNTKKSWLDSPNRFDKSRQTK